MPKVEQCSEGIQPFLNVLPTRKVIQSPDNPLGLGTLYVWEEGDTLMLVALKYRRPSQWTELLDLNKAQISNNNYIMRPGDIIQIPEDWFPLPDYSFSTKFKGSSGVRI